MTVEQIAEGLSRTYGIELPRARELARKSLGIAEPTQSPEELKRDAAIDEKKEQSEIIKLFRAYGFTVYSTSQARAAKVTPGIPDLWVARAARIADRLDGRYHRPALAGWFESKRQVGGERSMAQIEFGDQCVAAGIPYAFGDRYAAGAWLVELGVAVFDGAGECGISPRVDA